MTRLAALALLLSAAAAAQPLPAGQRYAPGVDIVRYTFAVALSDTTDRAGGRATVAFEIASDVVGSSPTISHIHVPAIMVADVT